VLTRYGLGYYVALGRASKERHPESVGTGKRRINLRDPKGSTFNPEGRLEVLRARRALPLHVLDDDNR
jgi:hypothetical protein